MAIPRLSLTLSFKELLLILLRLLRLRPAGDVSSLERFEQQFAKRYQMKQGVYFCKARMAFYHLIRALKLPPGSEVVISSIHVADFINMIRLAGAKPVVVDLQPNSYFIDYQALEKALNEKTGLVLITHLSGYVTDMERIVEITSRHNVPLAEDCSQAFSATFKGKPLGTFGIAGIFSLSLLKSVCTLNGGMLITSRAELDAELRRVARAQPKPGRWPLIQETIKNLIIKTATLRFPFSVVVLPLLRLLMRIRPHKDHPDQFSKYQKSNKSVIKRAELPADFLTGVLPEQALLGLSQLESLVEREKRRIALGEQLYDMLSVCTPEQGVWLPERTTEAQNTFWLFPVQTSYPHALMSHLAANGIDSSRMLLSLLSQEEAFQTLKISTPQAQEIHARTLFIPLYWNLSSAEVTRIGEAILSFDAGAQNGGGQNGDDIKKKGHKRVLPLPMTPRLWSGVYTFLVNLLMARIFNRYSARGPLFVTWMLTLDCNLYCRFCATHSAKKQYPEALSLDRSLEIADELVKAGVMTVGFTGGEVLLHPHLFPLIERLKAGGMIVYVVTNGLLLKENAARLIASGVDYIVVSIDSDQSAVHDRTRGHPGLLKKVLDGIETFKQMRSGTRPLVKSTTVINRQNIEQIVPILNRLEAHVDVASAQPIVYDYHEHPHAKPKERLKGYAFEKEDQTQVAAAFNRATEEKSFLNNTFFRMIPAYWFTPDKLAVQFPCWAPFLRFMIFPDGRVRHCTANQKFGSVGNVTEQSVMAVWNSEEMQKHREEIRHWKRPCVCWSQDVSFNAFMHDLRIPNRLPRLGKKQDLFS
ncbi:aminotransferase class I/II-fold pyridoxal phosphate-dependent enzyme [Magnetococcales bacterium HHB-1]